MFRSAKKVYTRKLYNYRKGGISFFIDPVAPNWISTNRHGAMLLELANDMLPEDIALEYQRKFNLGFHKAWVHTCNFLNEASLAGMVFNQPPLAEEYAGRGAHLKTDRLNEFWIHLNDNCNLNCSHCLVESGPGKSDGLPAEDLAKIITQTASLGVKRYYITGGEPFLRNDLLDIASEILDTGAELIIMTNGTMVTKEIIKKLDGFDNNRLFFQVSLDGTTMEVNNLIRGNGFKKAVDGINLLIDAGFNVSIASTVFNENLTNLSQLPEFAAKLGCRSIHLMWPHHRGRAISGNVTFADRQSLESLLQTVHASTERLNLVLDNYESIKNRVNRKANIKFDLGNQCWDSLCLNPDGHIYPSAALAGIPSLDMGDAISNTIEKIWKESTVGREVRGETLINNSKMQEDPFRFILGGPDIEQSYLGSIADGDAEDYLSFDHTYDLRKKVGKNIMFNLSYNQKVIYDERRDSGSPTVYYAMGDNAVLCGDTAWGEDITVSTTHSNCVLAFDVEKPHRLVQEFYGAAAEKPQADLCCPVKYDQTVTSHIPQDVLDRFYGCGSPIVAAGASTGETIVDLGSGGGIDCFIASKKVGGTGSVIGIDMTDKMINVALENKTQVVKNLGFDNLEFRRGYLEQIPVDDMTVDLITSNCVINLSVNKKKVFQESFRILRDGGRFVVSDIVSDKPLPPHIKVNSELWGECLSGSLTESEFLQSLESSSFFGVELLSKTFWKEIEGYRFYSITVRAHKQVKSSQCRFTGQYAKYNGPLKSVVDEEGHVFNRHEMVEICTDTAKRLSKLPFSNMFTIVTADKKTVEFKTATEPACDCSSEGCC